MTDHSDVSCRLCELMNSSMLSSSNIHRKNETIHLTPEDANFSAVNLYVERAYHVSFLTSFVASRVSALCLLGISGGMRE